MATQIPKAKLTPVPPLLFSAETEKPISVKIKIEKGILHFYLFQKKWACLPIF